jgi:SAM-dependent methyltransferase
MSTSYLNLGCGNRFHPAWTNVDFVSNAPGVIAHNLLKGIPAADNSADVVYHSHVLEHFLRADGQRFVAECLRVLKPGGWLRVAVPDLEKIVRSYLDAMERASHDQTGWADKYDWIMLELYDQTIRTQTGGEMAHAIRTLPDDAAGFAIDRCGKGVAELRKPEAGETPNIPPFWRRLIKLNLYPGRARRWMIQRLLGPDMVALQQGRFRLAGEIHQWMYDAYSLTRLLRRTGFVDVERQTATESAIPDWTGYNLDTDPDGNVYKPDSLFVEGRKAAG